MKTMILLLLLPISLSAQLVDDYSAFAKKVSQPMVYHFTDPQFSTVTQRLTYLGQLDVSVTGHCKVFVSHTKLGGKGVNALVFVSGDTVYEYGLDMPEDGPFRIDGNTMYFREGDGTVKPMIVTEFSRLLCTPLECVELTSYKK